MQPGFNEWGRILIDDKNTNGSASRLAVRFILLTRESNHQQLSTNHSFLLPFQRNHPTGYRLPPFHWRGIWESLYRLLDGIIGSSEMTDS
jgi:hypothetical protein